MHPSDVCSSTNVIVICNPPCVALKLGSEQYVVFNKVNMTLFSFAETGYSRRRTRRRDLRLYKQVLGSEPPKPPHNRAILAQRLAKPLHVGLVYFLPFYVCCIINALMREFYNVRFSINSSILECGCNQLSYRKSESLE